MSTKANWLIYVLVPILLIIGTIWMYWGEWNPLTSSGCYRQTLERNIAMFTNTSNQDVVGLYKVYNYSSSVVPSYHIECINSGPPRTIYRTAAGVILNVNDRNFVALTSSTLIAENNEISCRTRGGSVQCQVLSSDSYYGQAFILCDTDFKFNHHQNNMLSAVNILEKNTINTSKKIKYFKYYTQYNSRATLNLFGIAKFNIYDIKSRYLVHHEHTERSTGTVSVKEMDDNALCTECVISISGNVNYEKNGFFYHYLMHSHGFYGSGVVINGTDILIGIAQGFESKFWFYGEGQNRISGVHHPFFQINYQKYVL